MPLPRSMAAGAWPRWSRRSLPSLLLALATAAWLPAAAHAQLPAAVRSAEKFVNDFEAAHRSLAAAQQFEERYPSGVEVETVDRHLSAVRRFLSAEPTNDAATLLAVRLQRVRDGLAAQEIDWDGTADPAKRSQGSSPGSDYLAPIDEVLRRSPQFAAAHHWKARLLTEGTDPENFDIGPGSWIPWQLRSGESITPDFATVLEHAGRAVTLEPENPLYREFLAVELALADRFADAAAVMREGFDPEHPLRRMLEDLEALGVPPGATNAWDLQGFFLSTAMMGAADSGNLSFIDYLEARYRAWTVAMSLDDLAAFYRQRWPEWRFFEESGWEGAHVAALAVTDAGLAPVTDRALLEGDALDGRGAVSLMVVPPDVVGRLSSDGGPDSAPGSARLGIVLMNLRRAPER